MAGASALADGVPGLEPAHLGLARRRERAVRLRAAKRVDDERRVHAVPVPLAGLERVGAAGRGARLGATDDGPAHGESEQGFQVAPGQPERPGQLRRRAAMVGHDGRHAARLRGAGLPAAVPRERLGRRGRSLRPARPGRLAKLRRRPPRVPAQGGRHDCLARPDDPQDRRPGVAGLGRPKATRPRGHGRDRRRQVQGQEKGRVRRHGPALPQGRRLPRRPPLPAHLAPARRRGARRQVRRPRRPLPPGLRTHARRHVLLQDPPAVQLLGQRRQDPTSGRRRSPGRRRAERRGRPLPLRATTLPTAVLASARSSALGRPPRRPSSSSSPSSQRPQLTPRAIPLATRL
mmetsp:Transcript_12301/g.39140  ORF Transcript_12301/g.39140 Transcript_12301/m.39140 type:complete len:347 (-) Transcript_12301:234-1274(-)